VRGRRARSEGAGQAASPEKQQEQNAEHKRTNEHKRTQANTTKGNTISDRGELRRKIVGRDNKGVRERERESVRERESTDLVRSPAVWSDLFERVCVL
jgi:hypothetical protein